jgi:hypothetical protein
VQVHCIDGLHRPAGGSQQAVDLLSGALCSGVTSGKAATLAAHGLPQRDLAFAGEGGGGHGALLFLNCRKDGTG